MTYKKRIDGRDFDQLRDMEAKAGVIKKANGSGYFRIGKTAAYAAVYGPHECHPRFMAKTDTGILRVHYSMMPFSGMGNRVRPGPNRRAKELNLVIEKALAPVIDLSKYPGSAVDIYIELPQTDAGSRCASICAASIALADAGIIMKDMVPAVSVGRVDDKVVVDLDYQEEAYEDGPVADIPVAFIPTTKEISLLQLDGDVTKQILLDALDLIEKAAGEVKAVMHQAIKDKYAEAKQ